MKRFEGGIYMSLTANELILLNKNVNREVNHEIFENNSLANGDKRVLSSINNLIDNGILIKSQEFDTSINKLTVRQLRQILEQNNMKRSGNKQELINRIQKYYYIIEELELPTIYKATEKGMKVIKKTNYLNEFIYERSLTPARAYYIANRYLNEDVEDKIESIYKFEIDRLFNKEGDNPDLTIMSLIGYYENTKKDLYNTRKFTNILFYIRLEELINDLKNIDRYSLFYDSANNSLDNERISDRLKSFIKIIDTKIYEHLVFNKNLSIGKLFELFKNDINEFINYYNWDESLFYYYVELIEASTKKENEGFCYSKLLNWLDKYYTPELDDLEFDYYGDWEDTEEDHYISLTFDELLEIKDDITFSVDKEDGEIIPYLNEFRLNLFSSY